MRGSEPVIRKDSRLFAEICAAVLSRGNSVRFRVHGESMQPNLQDGDDVTVAPAGVDEAHRGDVVLAQNADGLVVHRVSTCGAQSGNIALRSDTGEGFDAPPERIYGKVLSCKRGSEEKSLNTFQTRFVHPLRVQIRRLRATTKLRLGRLAFLLFAIVSTLFVCGALFAPVVHAQTADLSLTQTPSASTVPASTTYTYSEVVKNVTSTNTVATNTVIVYMQTPPNTTYQGYAGTNWTCTNPGANNSGPVVCTYGPDLASGATASTLTVTFEVNAGVAAGTTIQNSATVTTNGNNAVPDSNPSNNTSLSTIYVEPAGSADVALSMSVSPTPVFVSAAINYTITVTNLGPAQATGVTVSDTLPSSLTFGSATPSQGTGCSGGLNLSCSLGAINAGSNATITVALTTPSSATTLINTATVTASSTDSNTANNSATTYTVVQPLSCATPGRDGAGGTLSGVVNAYYPPAVTGVLASGSTSVALGAAAASPAAQTSISSGDLLLIIQMQGSPINNSNTSSYGHGVPGDPGSGYTAVGNSGLFEFVTATNSTPVTTAGGTVTFAGTGASGGLLNTYSYELPLASTSVGTVTAASWANNVATFTFSTLPSTLVPNAVLTTTGFTPAGYNVTKAPILSVNTTTKTVTVAMTTNPGTETALGTATYLIPGQQTFQVIRVPQYTSATLSSNLTALAWNGSLGGVLAIDVASQLTLGGTVALDSLGFRGGGGVVLTGTTGGAVTDYVFASPGTLTSAGTDASKGEGIAGTPHWLAPLLSPGGTAISPSTTASSSGQSYTEGLVGGSFARGAPGNAGGGGTDGLPSNNSYNSGGGAGGNGGTGGQGGYGWNSMAATNSTDGGFGGVSFPASTSALIMGGAGGAGTTNDGSYYTTTGGGNADCGANCTGIYSSGGAGGGIVIIHAGSVTGAGTITSNGESTLSTENDSTGGGGAGGSILIFSNSGNLSGLTVNAIGGSAGDAWPTEGPDENTTGFPGQRHGPGGGGGGGVIFLSAPSASSSVAGGANGYTDTVQDSYGATPGQAGTLVTSDIITETPGTQSGAYCGSADLAVTNSAPTVVTAGNDITYTQTVTNNGPLDAVNAVFSESIPANTSYVGYTAPGGWTCQTPITTTFTCTNPDVPASPTAQQFTLTVLVPSTVAYGTQIVDTDNVTSGTSDPNLANNSATVTTSVGLSTQADLAVTLTASAPTVTASSNFTMSATVTNNGPATASNLVFSEPLASNTAGTIVASLVSYSAPGWSCSTYTNNGILTLNCLMSSLAAGTANASTITITETAPSSAASGTVLSSTATIAESTLDPNYSNNSSSASILVAAIGQADLAVAASGTPNPVTAGNNITYVQTVTNNGPTAITATSGTSPTTVTFTDTIPANTTLVSFTPPSNWTCNTIAVGGTGTFTCTLNAGQTLNTIAFGSNYSASFPMVVKVNAGTTAGTTITNSPSVSSSVSDPNSANNTATVNTTVASPTQAYVTINKTASPEPVNENANLAYTIVVTNNGPAIAQNVVVTDPIQTAQVSYVSSNPSQGSCTEASNTVTCTIGNLSVGSSATIVINVTPIVVGSSSITCNGQSYNTCNTATLTTGTSNPNPNTSSSAGSTLQYSTAVDFASLSALQQTDGSVRVVWRTLEESRNLGFHIYRQDASGQHRVDSSLIAGSALILRHSRPQHAAKSYAWVDTHPVPGAAYWVEDVDINGTHTMHGPTYPELVSSTTNQQQAAQAAYPDSQAISPSLRQVQSNVARTNEVVPRPTTPLPPQPPTAPAGTPPFNTAGYPAVKIYVDQEGWYHIPFAQLSAAGLEPNTDVRLLHLYAEGVEQPLLLIGHTAGYPAPTDAIEFYGTGINTPFSGTRVYWLIRENSYGKRIAAAPAAYSAGVALESFPFTTIREDHTTYFAALLNGENNDNFFGDIVTSDPVDETLTVVHRDTSSTAPLMLTLALQGVTDQQEHAVTVQFNGTNIGTLAFYGEILATQTYSVDPSVVLDGTNSVTLTALEGDNDVSVVQSVQLQYPHTYTADSDWLKATANSGSELQISGFGNSGIRLFDISDPLNIVELGGQVSSKTSGTYSISATVPAGQPSTRTILAFSQNQLSAPSSLVAYTPTNLNQQRNGGDIVIITHPDFATHLAPLVNFRTSQGYKVVQVTTDELFDQYNFGERSPFALQTYLQNAESQWQRKPQAILLVGDASMDPRNYLGLGDFDFVPTRIIETAAFKTASDDWFTDFQQTGFATVPTGRLPVRTTSDLDLIISKIIGYEQGQSAGAWNSQVLLIADQNVDANFSGAANAAAAIIPSYLQTAQILTNGMDPSTAQSQIVNALNNGALIVDYNGHGAEQQWSFSDIFDDTSAAALTNGGRLPVYLLMDCLNGLFQDVYAETLAKSLILAPNGGAVAVWASSGFTNQPPQAAMELALLSEFSAHPHEMLGLMVLRAKSGTTDDDVRRTWILFGDPAMKLHFTSVANSHRPIPNPPVSKPPRNCMRGVPCPLERPQ